VDHGLGQSHLGTVGLHVRREDWDGKSTDVGWDVRRGPSGMVAAASEKRGYEKCEGEAELHAVGFIVASGDDSKVSSA
jgi:hypothetical protein